MLVRGGYPLISTADRDPVETIVFSIVFWPILLSSGPNVFSARLHEEISPPALTSHDAIHASPELAIRVHQRATETARPSCEPEHDQSPPSCQHA